MFCVPRIGEECKVRWLCGGQGRWTPVVGYRSIVVIMTGTICVWGKGVNVCPVVWELTFTLQLGTRYTGLQFGGATFFSYTDPGWIKKRDFVV